MNIKGFVSDNKIASHLVTHWVGNVSGFNIAYYLSGGNRLNRELNGIVTGLGVGLACNLALHAWINDYFGGSREDVKREKDEDGEERKMDGERKADGENRKMDRKKKEKEEDANLVDSAEFLIEIIEKSGL